MKNASAIFTGVAALSLAANLFLMTQGEPRLLNTVIAIGLSGVVFLGVFEIGWRLWRNGFSATVSAALPVVAGLAILGGWMAVDAAHKVEASVNPTSPLAGETLTVTAAAPGVYYLADPDSGCQWIAEGDAATGPFTNLQPRGGERSCDKKQGRASYYVF